MGTFAVVSGCCSRHCSKDDQRHRLVALSIIFSWTGSALVNCWQEVLTAATIGIVAATIIHIDADAYDITLKGHTLAIFPVAFALVFRTGMSYNRFFEGRGHCGKFVHSARTICRRARTHLHPADNPDVIEFKKTLGRYLHLFACVQKHSIRHTEGEAIAEAHAQNLLTLDEKAELEKVAKNLPQQVLIWVGREVVKMRPFMIHPDVLIWMEESIQGLMEGWMGMHKLATTPMPFPFIQMLLTLMYVWMYTLPFPIASSFGWASPPVAILLGLALFGLNAIGAELEDPMGEETNDLPYEVFEGAVKGAVKVCQLGFPEASQAPEQAAAVLSGDQLHRPASASITMLSPAAQTQANPIHQSSSSPGVMPTVAPAALYTPQPQPAASPAAVVSPAAAARSPVSPTTSGFLGELRSCSSLAECSKGFQEQLGSLFDRYDMDGSNTISASELRQLVTNVSYSLKLGKNNKALQAQVEQVSQDINWNLADFTQWLLQAAKTLNL